MDDGRKTKDGGAGEPPSPREAGFKQGVVYQARKELEGVVVHTAHSRSPGNLWALSGEE